MADSLEDLGGYTIFPIEPNWAQTPKVDFEFQKTLISFKGTTAQLETHTDYVPEVWQIGFTPDKSDEYDLTDFFVTQYGRNNAFWLKAPAREFTLESDALDGSTELRVEPNYAERIYQGHERLWIDMPNGDILTRKVISTTDQTTYLQLSLGTSLDRDITVSNHYKICRLLFCRFDEDLLALDFNADWYPQVVLQIRELVREYPA
jgi:hypothetical protein